MGDDGIYLPHFSKEEAIKACEEYNATLPYCNYKAQKRQTKLNFNLAFNHFKIIKENFLLNHGITSRPTWFGAHFDFDVGDYVIDKTGLPIKSEGLTLTKSILNGEYGIKVNSKYEGTWWSIENINRKPFNASVLCLKYEEGYCIKDGTINLFNIPCIETAKQ